MTSNFKLRNSAAEYKLITVFLIKIAFTNASTERCL